MVSGPVPGGPGRFTGACGPPVNTTNTATRITTKSRTPAPIHHRNRRITGEVYGFAGRDVSAAPGFKSGAYYAGFGNVGGGKFNRRLTREVVERWPRRWVPRCCWPFR